MRSCQPGPSSWKNSSTSRSTRKVTISFVPGTTGGFGGGAGAASTGFEVADLKAASAAWRGSLGRRVRYGPWDNDELPVVVRSGPPEGVRRAGGPISAEIAAAHVR
jgi:hypothetical protein